MKKLDKPNLNFETIITYFSNTYCDAGLYVCKNCGQKIFLDKYQILQKCKKCGSDFFTKE